MTSAWPTTDRPTQKKDRRARPFPPRSSLLSSRPRRHSVHVQYTCLRSRLVFEHVCLRLTPIIVYKVLGIAHMRAHTTSMHVWSKADHHEKRMRLGSQTTKRLCRINDSLPEWSLNVALAGCANRKTCIIWTAAFVFDILTCASLL